MQFTDHFLISLPSKDNTIFTNSVVYVTNHTLLSGAIGVIINKPISDTLVDMFKNVDITTYGPTWSDNMLYLGGPVRPNNGFFLRKLENDLVGNYELTGDKNYLHNLNSDLFMSVGYSQWEPWQLESEIKNSLWLVAKGNKELIFEVDPAVRYSEALKLVGVKNVSQLYFSGAVFA